MTLMTHRSLIAAAMLCMVVPVNSFLYNPSVNPNLNALAQAQLGKLLKIRLDIGKKAEKQRMALQGPVIKLLDSVTKTLPLPGASGPTPQISSGSKSVEIVKDGFVIDMNGSKKIPFQDGCWEMIWKEGARSGTIVCGFKLPEPVSNKQAGCIGIKFDSRLSSHRVSQCCSVSLYFTDQAKRCFLSRLQGIHELSCVDKGKSSRGPGLQGTSTRHSPWVYGRTARSVDQDAGGQEHFFTSFALS